jgi:hypothetical protein
LQWLSAANAGEAAAKRQFAERRPGRAFGRRNARIADENGGT